MKEVTKDDFYSAVGRLNVSPSIVNDYEHRGRGYIAEWRLPNRQLVGKTESGDFPLTPKKYFLVA